MPINILPSTSEAVDIAGRTLMQPVNVSHGFGRRTAWRAVHGMGKSYRGKGMKRQT